MTYAQFLPVKGTPCNLALNHAFEAGSEIIIVGIANGDRFSIDLMSGMTNYAGMKPTDIALHLSARFNENVIVRNSMYNDTWQTEHRDGGMPIRPHQVFSIKIRSEAGGYMVFVNESMFTYYKHPKFPNFVTEVDINGDVTLSSVIYQANLVGLGSACSQKPCNIPMKRGFVPGTQLSIQGIAQATEKCFAIDLEACTGNVKNIAMHFKPIFKDKVIVRNSLINNVWGREEKDSPMSIRTGNQFDINIKCEPEGYKIYINNSLFTFYKHRLTPHGVNNILITGGVIVNKVTYNPI